MKSIIRLITLTLALAISWGFVTMAFAFASYTEYNAMPTSFCLFFLTIIGLVVLGNLKWNVFDKITKSQAKIGLAGLFYAIGVLGSKLAYLLPWERL